MTSPNLNARLSANSTAVISLFRVVVGFLFALHGASILFGWPMPMKTPVGTWPGWWAGLIEFVTGLLVMVGLFTRPAAFLASGNMAVAYFWMHQPKALWPFMATTPEGVPPNGNNGELSILYCFAFFLLVFIGPGRFAVETMRARHGRSTGHVAPQRRPGLMSRFRRR
jgi:putative oxidoreductase